ncbi:hypothetical protein ASPVEDRAFT_152382 [Aspergillus versicolor CBS 583.65]|uniref:G domain-containing protein n=1 Tax=Aspergillus versicolor CBS 583.65 TaxID=1036611 RepID=A0A1L9PR19_ASPVE|nr:uncharacterized protein ASPVEDRAFT_152382 [Aspergillus versicolor CBS 583.65]OJJ03959.1 hypothetical protein ASPVEDRAFT_152382 [Aspergillus versicolor CBS 583.65]
MSEAERTKECLSELEAHFRETKTPSDALVILGRTGSGKSSLLEDLSGLSGYSQQSVDSVTTTIQLCKAIVNDKPYFVMDTPGFDPNAEEKTFREIIRGVNSIRRFARITGLLYLTCIPQERFDDFDRKLIQFIRALSGPQYIPRVTFITTFWTATPGQAATYSQRLASLQCRWEDGLGVRGLKTYQHGWEYNGAGGDRGVIIDWFVNREQIAQHAREMVARNYSSPSIVASRIEEQLDANVPIHQTDAGRLLGLPAPRPSQFPTDANEDARPRDNASSHTGASSPHTSSNATWEQAAAPPPGTSPSQVILEGLSWVFRNINFGSAAGGASSRPSVLRGGGDPFSPVDVMKSRGLDSSREGRLKYAQQHGIGGVPFSASWGEAMLRHLQRNG